jgi:hypothetical protein
VHVGLFVIPSAVIFFPPPIPSSAYEPSSAAARHEYNQLVHRTERATLVFFLLIFRIVVNYIYANLCRTHLPATSPRPSRWPAVASVCHSKRHCDSPYSVVFLIAH